MQGQQGPVFQRGKRDNFRQVRREVGEIHILAAGVDDQEQPVFPQASDHQVVDNAAGLVGQQCVALAARFQAGDVAGDQAFQRGCDVGSGEHRLAHVRDVEQTGVRTRMQMLGEDAAFAARRQVAIQVVLHRHGIARERHHAGAVATMPGIERNRVKRRGGGVVWQGVPDHACLRQTGPPASGMPAAMTPLCHGT